MKRKYGWKADNPDFRDFLFPIEKITLPSKTNNISLMPPVYNQGQVGRCTGAGIAGAMHYDLIKQKLPVFTPSMNFIYYNERAMEGTVNSDSGANIRDGIKSIANQGVCSNTEWSDAVSNWKKKPTTKCYSDALKNKAVLYRSVPVDINSIKTVMAQGYPIVFGFTVYESFESDIVTRTGIVPMPKKSESALGGHCVDGADFDDSKRACLCRNSWGAAWGLNGNFWLPYDYFTSNLVSDIWVVTNIL